MTLAALAPRSAARAAGAGARRRRRRGVHVADQRHAADASRAGDARPRDGAVVRLVPGLDADRRPDRRCCDGGLRRARRTRHRRGRLLRGRSGRWPDAAHAARPRSRPQRGRVAQSTSIAAATDAIAAERDAQAGTAGVCTETIRQGSVGVAGDGQRPALGEARQARRAAAQHAGSCRGPRCSGARAGRRRSSSSPARRRRRARRSGCAEPAGRERPARVRPLGSPGCSSSWTASGGGNLAQLGVGAVDGLGPGVDRAPRGDLEDVRREARVGQAQVERRGARVAAELQVRELGDLEARRACSARRRPRPAPRRAATARRPNGSGRSCP